MASVKEFIQFINKSPSPFHAVDECRKYLVAAGFQELKESDRWTVKPKDKYFVTRNQSALVAFAVGADYIPGNGFAIVGAHTDSPCLKVKPISKQENVGFVQLGVECYGGGTWHSWLDRDLKVAGRVFIRSGSRIEQRLVDIDRPVARVPNIAIHLQRDLGQKFEFNKEQHLTPVIATVLKQQLESPTAVKMEGDATDLSACESNQSEKHPAALIKLICTELDVSPQQILDFELCLADAVPATLGGVYEEFIFAPRLDNLHSCFCALKGLIQSCTTANDTQDPKIRMITLFDNEEVGSSSAQGADSTLLELILRRLSVDGPSPTTFEESMCRSMVISADMAHGVHPNYSDKHEKQHRPALNKGIVIKYNANQRYATTSATSTLVREVARMANVPLQDFVVRNDMACGSTIGPMVSSKLGIPTIDLGAAQLSMHSIREMCDVSCVQQSIDLFRTFFIRFHEVLASIDW